MKNIPTTRWTPRTFNHESNQFKSIGWKPHLWFGVCARKAFEFVLHWKVCSVQCAFGIRHSISTDIILEHWVSRGDLFLLLWHRGHGTSSIIAATSTTTNTRWIGRTRYSYRIGAFGRFQSGRIGSSFTVALQRQQQRVDQPSPSLSSTGGPRSCTSPLRIPNGPCRTPSSSNSAPGPTRILGIHRSMDRSACTAKMQGAFQQ